MDYFPLFFIQAYPSVSKVFYKSFPNVFYINSGMIDTIEFNLVLGMFQHFCHSYTRLGGSVNVHFSSSTGNAAVLIVIAPSSMLDNKVKNLSVYLLLVIICVELLASLICLLVYAGIFSFNFTTSLRKALKVFFAYTL